MFSDILEVKEGAKRLCQITGTQQLFSLAAPGCQNSMHPITSDFVCLTAAPQKQTLDETPIAFVHPSNRAELSQCSAALCDNARIAQVNLPSALARWFVRLVKRWIGAETHIGDAVTSTSHIVRRFWVKLGERWMRRVSNMIECRTPQGSFMSLLDPNWIRFISSWGIQNASLCTV